MVRSNRDIGTSQQPSAETRGLLSLAFSFPPRQTFLSQPDLTREGMPQLVRSLEREVGSASSVSAAGNPFQPTLFDRGFAASPLQGTPQGLAVYVNGMRFNQRFGDTVYWDLIPDVAIDKVNLEGSNPVFGLNAPGGSINVRLKDAQETDLTVARDRARDFKVRVGC